SDSSDQSAAGGADHGNHPAATEVDRHPHFAALDVGTPAFRRYSAAVERNNLPEAGDALSAATDRPVTQDLVAYVNEELGLRTTLTPDQIAAAANGVPGFRAT